MAWHNNKTPITNLLIMLELTRILLKRTLKKEGASVIKAPSKMGLVSGVYPSIYF
jgi:short-subunit dehydrogenase